MAISDKFKKTKIHTGSDKDTYHDNASSKKEDPAERFIRYVRVVTILTVVFATVLVGYFSYAIIRDLLIELRDVQDRAIIDTLFRSCRGDILAKRAAAEAVANLMLIQCPEASDWPFCSVPQQHLDLFMSTYLYLSTAVGIGFAPKINVSMIVPFQFFASELFLTDPKIPDDINPYIYGLNYSFDPPIPYLDTNGYNPNSKYTFLFPLLQQINIDNTSAFIMYNMHTSVDLGQAIDNIYECTLLSDATCNNLISDIFVVPYQNYEEIPMSSVVFPIMLSDNSFVGVSSVLFEWTNVFQTNLQFEGTLQCVVISPTQQYTYVVKKTGASLMCVGDCHDDGFSVDAVDMMIIENNAGVDFKLHCYCVESSVSPTGLPFYTCLITVCVFAFMSVVLATYERLIKRDSFAKQVLLDSKRAYVRFMSHEIRTPINAVSLGMKLLGHELRSIISEPATPKSSLRNLKLKECYTIVGEVEDSSNTAIKVLNDLLEYDKIEQNTIQIVTECVPLYKLVLKTLRPLLAQAREANITVNITIDGTLYDWSLGLDLSLDIVVYGDDVKLGQVFRNIFANALKFSPKDSLVDVTVICDKTKMIKGIECPQNCQPLGVARVLVKDYGPGLSEDELKCLFGEGVQFNPNRLQAGQGSGLGLWISKSIVEKHCGTINATSAGYNLGSEFLVELPIYVFTGLKEERFSLKVQGESFTAALVETTLTDNTCKALQTVLIVDDDPVSRKIVNRILKKKGYTCTEAVDGIDCLGKMRETAFDLVLLDYEMPQMNGPDVVETLRKEGNMCVVFGLTGNCLPEDIDYFLSKGANKVLTKPLKIEALNALVSQYFFTTESVKNDV